jgi:hypothetical protein
MKYPYEDMSWEQFERLIIILCQELFGPAVQGFATGPDGGRDARFVGKAERFPSQAGPWDGTVIFQAKHTNGYNRHFLESDFFSTENKTSTIVVEAPRIKTLKEAGQLTHYMLFANRRLAGNANEDILDYLSAECVMPKTSIYLCGLEQLEIWLKKFPAVAPQADLDPIDSPLLVSSDELAIVVEAIARGINAAAAAVDQPPKPRTPYVVKNALNNMSEDYAKELRKRYLKDTAQIGAFLAAPENAEVQLSYAAAVEEFQLAIVAKRRDHQSFDAVMEYLVDLLMARDAVLRQTRHKRLTRAVLFYMYWFCDIGEDEDAASE